MAIRMDAFCSSIKRERESEAESVMATKKICRLRCIKIICFGYILFSNQFQLNQFNAEWRRGTIKSVHVLACMCTGCNYISHPYSVHVHIHVRSQWSCTRTTHHIFYQVMHSAKQINFWPEPERGRWVFEQFHLPSSPPPSSSSSQFFLCW